MSLLFPDRLHISLRPGRVQALVARGRASALAAGYDLACDAGADELWQEHIAHCATVLEQSGARRLRIIVGDAIARYQVLGWNPDLKGRVEELAYAQLGFDAVYGDGSSADWRFAISQGAPGEDRLVAALPRALCEGVERVCAEHGAVIESLRPAMVAVLDARVADLPKAAWFMSVQDQRASYLYRDAGGCRHAGSVRVVDASTEAQMQALERVARSHGASIIEASADAEVVLVDARAVPNAVAAAGPRRVQWLGLAPTFRTRWRPLSSLGLDELQLRSQFADLLRGVGA